MIIKSILIENYKSFQKFELEFNNDLNIIVGDNEAGKSTLLEAINLALTSQLNGRNISYELSPFLFNKVTVQKYVKQLQNGEKNDPPKILIELYLQDSPDLAKLKGNNNSKRENAVGLFLLIQFNDEYGEEYRNYIMKPEEILTVPTEYFEVKWYSFAYNQITLRSLPIKTILIDTTSVRLQNGTDYYIQKSIEDILEDKEKAGLSLLYRKLKENFANEDSIKALNARLKTEKSISLKELTISVDTSHKSNWDANLTSYLDDIPYSYIGKGDQNILKMVLALERKKAKESNVILIEEPENHLSFSTMHKLIQMISNKCIGKQLIITTHSALILNKLGIEKLILLGDKKQILTLKNLSVSTQNYFKKLPGYDTLRLVLAKKSILVEGPSDELFVQRAYKQMHGVLPIENGIDVISVKGLSFKRFLDIAKILEKEVSVVTDNDGDCDKVTAKYEEYSKCKSIQICFDPDIYYPTLEPQIVKFNGIESLNKIFTKTFKKEEELIEFMVNNKTECALNLFETPDTIVIPTYIQHAIE